MTRGTRRRTGEGRLAALACLAIVVSLAPSRIGAALAVLAAAIVAGLAWRTPRYRALLRAHLRPFFFVAAFVLATVAVFSGVEEALIATGRVVGMLVVAAVVAVTVSHADMMEVLGRLLRPLRRMGLRPERIALTLSLTMTTAPVLIRHARTIREVQRMRGLRAGPRFVLPLLVVALRHADTMADSMTARGL